MPAQSSCPGHDWRGELDTVVMFKIGNPDLPHTYSYVPDIAAGLATLGTDARAMGQVWHLPGPPTGTTRALLDLATPTGCCHPS